MELSLNIKVIQLAKRLVDEKVEGIIETLPMFVSVLIHYDSLVLSPKRLRSIINSVWNEMAGEVDTTLASRLIELPVYYCDPLTRECVEQYSRQIASMEDNPTYVARINRLSGPDELVRRHSSTQHWVAGMGFYAGTPELLPLDPRVTLTVPKYNPPRLFTVAGGDWRRWGVHFNLSYRCTRRLLHHWPNANPDLLSRHAAGPIQGQGDAPESRRSHQVSPNIVGGK